MAGSIKLVWEGEVWQEGIILLLFLIGVLKMGRLGSLQVEGGQLRKYSNFETR